MPKKNTKAVIKKKNIVVVDDTKPIKKPIKVIKPPADETEDDDVHENEFKKETVETQDEVDLNAEEEDDNFSDNKNEIDDEDKEIDTENNEGVIDEVEEEEEEEEEEVEPEIDALDAVVDLADDEKGEKEPLDYDDDKCIYNFADDKSDDEVELVFDDDIIPETSDVVPPDQRRSKPILFKYERVRIIGDRTQQLTLGAKPMMKNTEHLNPKQVAELELQNDVIPLIIQRPLPNGKKEKWYIKELKH